MIFIGEDYIVRALNNEKTGCGDSEDRSVDRLGLYTLKSVNTLVKLHLD